MAADYEGRLTGVFLTIRHAARAMTPSVMD